MASFNNNPGSGAPDKAADFHADMDELDRDDDSTTVKPEESSGEEEEEEPRTPKGEAPEGEDEEKGEEESEEEEEEPREVEEGEEEEPEGVRPLHSRPTVGEIKKKFPDFFKTFPDMRHMLFREGEYGKVFPTVEDARGAAEDAESFRTFSSLVTSGKAEDFGEFLNGVKDVKGLDSMAANFLPQLYKVDQATYFRVTSPIGETLVRNAYAAAIQAGNKDLQNAALHVAQWAFGDVKFATGEKRSEELKPAEQKKDPDLERERSEFYKQKYTDAQTYVQSNGHSKLSAEIRRGLDPNNAFTPSLRNLLVKEVLSEIGNMLDADERHMGVMNSLWRQAHKAGYTGDWKDRILSTYLSRARQLMPAIRKRIRDGAIRSSESNADEEQRVAEKSSKRKEVPGSGQSGARSAQNGRPPAARDIDWSKTSDMDLLNDKPVLKRK